MLYKYSPTIDNRLDLHVVYNVHKTKALSTVQYTHQYYYNTLIVGRTYKNVTSKFTYKRNNDNDW